MLSSGANAIVECGPGKVLTGLNRRIERNKEIAILAIEDTASLQEALNLNQ
jgi:[acyl-carrier-protein] S-malonyltransferase